MQEKKLKVLEDSKADKMELYNMHFCVYYILPVTYCHIFIWEFNISNGTTFSQVKSALNKLTYPMIKNQNHNNNPIKKQ